MSTQIDHRENAAGPPRAAALIITTMEGIEGTAATLATQLKMTVEIAANRAAALRLLNRRAYAIVILDQMLADTDPEGSEMIWKNVGVAVPLQINFALAGSARLEREIRSALTRRERERQIAVAAAAAAVDAELKNAITGFLLEARLALAEENVPPRIASRLRTLEEMAGKLRNRLLPTVSQDTTTVSLLVSQK
jgi:hypothetical protein